ncbi:hypothetical protein [Streptomyces solincola]|uniref:hypothetical protein n=1 Tax=Streptomyces solincola TaxID=2100817 RepID=UPI0011B2260E|nr:hypothetical protein [Streptomyces solincola]
MSIEWKYRHTGWSAHSGAGGRMNYWLARYEDGVQVEVYEMADGRLRRFSDYRTAKAREVSLNQTIGVAPS